MAESILTSTKAGLGLAEDHTAFDTQLIILVNSVLSRLTQLGVGPSEGFRITGKTETWETFLGPDQLLLNNAMSYMIQRVQLMFDPPEIGFVLTAIKEQIEKDEWLLNVTVDNKPLSEVSDDDTVWIVSSDEALPEEMESGEVGIDPANGDVWRKA